MPPMQQYTEDEYPGSFSGTKRPWTASNGSESDSDDTNSNDSGKKKKKLNRMLLRDWLVDVTNRGLVPGLEWLNKEKTLIKVPWTHASRHGWDKDKDSCLFRMWAEYTDRLNSSPPKKWKANFRCAMNSLPDVEEDKSRSTTKGLDAFKVYLLKSKKCRSAVSGSKKQSESHRSVTKADRVQRTKIIRENTRQKHSMESEPQDMIQCNMPLYYNNMESTPSYSIYDRQPIIQDQPPMVIPKSDISETILQELKQASSNDERYQASLDLFYHHDSGSEMKFDDSPSQNSNYKFIPTVVEETSDYNSNGSGEDDDSNDMNDMQDLKVGMVECYTSQMPNKYTSLWSPSTTYNAPETVMSRFNNLPTVTRAEHFTTEYTALNHNEQDLGFESI